MLKYYFHCSDGYDLVVDREGRELGESDLLWIALDAAARLMSELQTYDGWADWVVAIHDERGSLMTLFHSQRSKNTVPLITMIKE